MISVGVGVRLRSGKVKTTLSTREEVSSIFDNHGGFDHKARDRKSVV